MSFDKLSKTELLRTLEEDFAFELSEEEKATKATVLAAIAEGGLNFRDYLAANPEQAEKFKPEKIEPAAPVQNIEVDGVVVKDTNVSGEAPWLIKMERLNSHFEVGKYVWTKEHPYALVDVQDVEKVLAEDKMRQALPSEVAEYYG